MDLTSARGTKVSDIVIDHRPSTGRGKKLTPAQEGVLRELFEQALPSVPKGAPLVKSFWVNVASRFREDTGREYSWLSVKRRAAGWHQGSPEDERPVDVSRASVISGENPVTENEPEAAVCEPQGPEVPSNIPRPALSQNGTSPQRQEPVNLDRTDLEKSPGVPDGMQGSFFSSVKASKSGKKKSGKKPKSSRKSRTRRRSRSPDLVSRPRHRHCSSSPKRRTKRVSRRLHHQLASASHDTPASGSKPASDAPADLNPAWKPNSSGLDHVRDLLGEDDTGNLLRHSTRSPLKEDPVSDSLLEFPELSDPDDLPVTPILILRRRAVAKER
jgi:hypothetical protein